jgi:hypothetical protein
MGYFKSMYDRSRPVSELNQFDYVFFGLMVLAAPLCAPLYWLGRLAKPLFERSRA